MPPEINVSPVSALYKDLRSLFVGAIAVALIIAYKSGEPWLQVCSADRACRLRTRLGRQRRTRLRLGCCFGGDEVVVLHYP